jgi:hypothetical protein
MFSAFEFPHEKGIRADEGVPPTIRHFSPLDLPRMNRIFAG